MPALLQSQQIIIVPPDSIVKSERLFYVEPSQYEILKLDIDIS